MVLDWDRAVEAGEVIEVLEHLLRPPAWHADAACQEHPETEFFPELGQSAAPAKLICSGCLVRTECGAHAIAAGEDFGVWGGMSPAERKAIRRRLNAA